MRLTHRDKFNVRNSEFQCQRI